MPSRRPFAMLLVALAFVAGCGRAIERPLHGAPPGSEAPSATSAVPPTLQPSDTLRFRPLPTPSPGISLSPSPSPIAVASPSPAPAPPIVRTIAPGPNANAPAGAPVTVSAVLVGRGADLSTATLTVNGADAGAAIDKRSARDWTIHATQPLGRGAYTARVLVRDSSGANGGFTWQFTVGEPEPTAAEPTAAAPAAPPARTPQPKPTATP